MDAANDRWRNAPERDTHVADAAAIEIHGRGKADLGNGLGAPRANLAVDLSPRRMTPRKDDAVDDLIGREVHDLVARMKTLVRNAASASDGHEFELGVVREQRGRRIGGW